MKNLLGFEFRKLWQQKSFYICGAVILIISILSIALTRGLVSLSDGMMPMPSAAATMLSAVSSSEFTLVCGIFITLFVCTDYRQHTIKNIYSRGFSRTQVYFSKLIACLAATAILFAATLLFNYIAGLIVLNGPAEDGNYFGLLAGQLIYCLAYSALVFGIAMCIKRTGAVIAITILAPMLIGLVINLADLLAGLENIRIGDYWIGNLITELSSLSTDVTRLLICIALSIAYGAIFAGCGYLLNRRHEC